LAEPSFGHHLSERRLALRGPLDQDAAGALRLVLQRAAGGSHRVVVDLTEVTQLASAGVRVLYDVLNAPAVGPGHLVLFAPPGSAAQHVLSLVRLPYRAIDPDRRY
jgi:ABC-type transporter Mla MlaB component